MRAGRRRVRAASGERWWEEWKDGRMMQAKVEGRREKGEEAETRRGPGVEQRRLRNRASCGARDVRLGATTGTEGLQCRTHLIVSFSMPSSTRISMIFWRWSPCSWMTLPISSCSTIEPLHANSSVDGVDFKSVLASKRATRRSGTTLPRPARRRRAQADALLNAFRSFLGSYSGGTPCRVVIVLRPLRCWMRMWMWLAGSEWRSADRREWVSDASSSEGKLAR